MWPRAWLSAWVAATAWAQAGSIATLPEVREVAAWPAEAPASAIVVSVGIDATGKVTDVLVLEPGGPEVDERAAALLRAARFFPAGSERGPAAARALYRVVLAPGRRPALELLGAEPAETYVVRAAPVREATERRLAVEEVVKIPGTTGDTLKVVQNLPGVARPAFAGGEIVVWGSSPRDTGVYLDGVRIPRLYHFGGLRSVVQSPIVRSVDFVPGAYGPRHGRGLGGLVQVETRAPRRDRLHGEAAADVLDASLLVEGPLTTRTSGLVAARRSYVDALLPAVVPDDVLRFSTAPRYWDYQALGRHDGGRLGDWTLLLLGSDDVLALLADDPDPERRVSFSFQDAFHRAVARHEVARGKDRFDTTLSAGWTSTGVEADPGRTSGFFFDLDVIDYGARLEWSREVGARLEVAAGLDVEGAHATVRVRAPQPPREDDPGGFERSATLSDVGTFDIVQAAPWVETPITLGRLRIAPGLRLDVYGVSGYRGTADELARVDYLLEPRLQARYQVTPRLAAKAAAGLYHQLPEGVELSRTYGDPDLAVPWDVQTAAGVEAQAAPRLRVEAQGFYKVFRDLVVAADEPGPLVENDGTGRVYGGELLIRRDPTERFFGWVAYTFMVARRRDHAGQDERPFDFDQTHILTALASRKLPRRWEVGARFRLTSGNPYTPVIDRYLDARSGDHRPVYAAATNSGRLPAFHALDLRVEKGWKFPLWELAAYLELINAYNRRNPEGVLYNFDYTERAFLAGLPVLPVLGARGSF